jgi:formate dehydrogenase subunit gamma
MRNGDVGRRGTQSDLVKERIEPIVRDHAQRPGSLLLVFHAVQRELGFVPDDAVPLIANAMNLSRAEVHGVLSFYHYFRRSPRGQHVVKICRAEACQSMKAESLAAHAQRRLEIGFHETTADGRFTLEPVYCLGNCACSPAIMIDEELHGRVSAATFDALIAAREAEA